MKNKRQLKPRTASIDDNFPDAKVEEAKPAKKPGKVAKGKAAKKTAVSPDMIIPDDDGIFDLDAAVGERKKPKNKAAQQSLEEWSGNSRAKRRDILFEGICDQVKERYGHRSAFTATDMKTLVVGLPMPSLALEWLIGNSVLPLGLVMMIIGKWGTCKSSLLAEIFRWFTRAGGGGFLIDTETKFSPEHWTEIMRLPPDSKAFNFLKGKSLEDMQQKLTYLINWVKKEMVGTTEEPGPGRTVPTVFGIDSWAGKMSEKTIEKIKRDGISTLGGPIEANLASKYLASMAGEFDDWPFSLIATNHQKDPVNMDGGYSSKTDCQPGGTQSRFQRTFEFTTELWRSKIDTEKFDGMGVRIKCSKNSIGPTGRFIKTRMLMWDTPYEADDGSTAYKHTTRWDWDWATISMLNEMKPKYKARLKVAGFDLTVNKPDADAECAARCKCLGMGDKDWLSWTEVGAMIRKNKKLSDQIRVALGIHKQAILKGDYLEQIDGMKDQLP